MVDTSWRSNRIKIALGALAALSILGLTGREAASQSYDYFTSYSYFRIIGQTGTLVGRELNGIGLNGEILDGKQVLAVSRNNVIAGSRSLTRVWLLGTRFVGVPGFWRLLHGAGGEPVIFQAVLDDGSSLELQVTAAERHPEPAHRDVILYEVSYESAQGSQPLCGLDENGLPRLAIPLSGYWRLQEGTPLGGTWIDEPDAFTFACTDYVLAKCVLAGYKPWKRVLACAPGQGCALTTLRAHHQACTRALRADYCGDGYAHTTDGVEVAFDDALEVHVDDTGWPVEAEWGPDGAICVQGPRIDAPLPACVQDRHLAVCGDPPEYAAGTLLTTSVAPGP
jgi:hypothetical protein